MELIYLPQSMKAVLVASLYHLARQTELARGVVACGVEIPRGAIVLPGVGALDAGYLCPGCCQALALASLERAV